MKLKYEMSIVHFLLNFSILFLFGFYPYFSFAQSVTVTATVDRNEMEVGDTFTYSVQVSSENTVAHEQPALPDLSQFEVINSWAGQESRGTFTNGQIETVVSNTYNYNLAPRSAGDFQIGAAEVNASGQVFRTNPIAIKVHTPGQSPQAPPPTRQQRGRNQLPPGMPSMDDVDRQEEDLFSQLLRRRMGQGINQKINPNEAFFIQVVVDKKTVYEGEQLTASWYLVTRSQIADIDTLKYPALSGFWKEDIELATRLNFQPEVINGIPYQKALLASYALFPIKSGKYTIDPYQAKCRLIAANAFGLPQEGYATKQSESIPIEVLPRPVEGQQADFSGGVGEFELTQKMDTNLLKTNQPFTFSIRIDGRGNAKFVELPKVSWPTGFEVYDTKSSMKFFPNGQSFKEFEVFLIPRQVGPAILPEISFQFFNPKTKTYYKRSTTQVSLNVEKGEGAEQTMASAPLATKMEEQKPKKKELPGPVLSEDDFSEVSSASQVGLWGGMYLASLLGLIGFSYKKLFQKTSREDLKKMIERRMKPVYQFSSVGEWRKVGTETLNIIYSVLGELSGSGGASEEAAKLIEKAPPSFRRDVAPELEKVMKKLDVLAFAPEAFVGTDKEPKNIKELLSHVEKVLKDATKYDFSSREDS